MRTAERVRARLADAPRAAWLTLGGILAVALGLRLWGVRQGLPFAYNSDEADHFVPHAVAMFRDGTLNPHYFANPPGFTYVLHFAFGLWFGGGSGVVHAYRLHPDQLYTLARVIAALLGTAGVWLLYATGARLLGRAAGLLAAAVAAVAFLPVFYAHLALNDAPTLAPLTLSLLGTAGVLRGGRARDHVLAGVGLGLACAFKYTAGIVVLPYLAAVAVQYGGRGRDAIVPALLGLSLAGGCALLAFAVANPYALLDYHSFRHELAHQSSLSAESGGKLGAPRHGGLLYYLWSLTWGLGWVPAIAALAGAVLLCLKRRALALVLVPAPILFLLFMGLQGRYFGRWLMPILPILCLLAAHAGVCAVGALTGRGGRARRSGVRPLQVAVAALVALLLIAQGAIYSVHSGMVLSRTDTRTIARRWLLANVPAGSPIVVEPISPDEWAHETLPGTSTASNPRRWNKYPSLVPRIGRSGALTTAPAAPVTIENYERTLAPALIAYYTEHGYCWVVSGSTQEGRAFADPAASPLAVAYYRALTRAGTVAFEASPYRGGAGPVAFNFDWSFDYYPLAYERPGPFVTVYRLHGGRCGPPAGGSP